MTPPITYDGDEISAITYDGDKISEVTYDGDTVFSAIPDSEIDYFEDTDFTEWTVGNGSQFSQTTSTVLEGNGAAFGGDNDWIYSTSGLLSYPQAGERFAYAIQFGSSSNDIYLYFGFQDKSNYYIVRINDGTLELQVEDAGNSTSLGSDTYTESGGVWEEAEVVWETNGDITVNLRETDGSPDADGTILASVSATDSTYTSGGVGLYSRAGTNYFDYLRVLEQI